jgi:hypothetical protein
MSDPLGMFVPRGVTGRGKENRKWRKLQKDITSETLGLFFDPEDGGDMFLRNVG